MGWVEHNTKPDGNDVLTTDLYALHPSFELQPRPGTPEADTVAGATDRVVIRGTATVDGAPLDARFFGADVVHDGLMTHCQYQLSSVTGGAFELTVLADTEQHGCGAAGSTIVFGTYIGNSQLTELHSTDALRWPGHGTATATISFSTTAPLGASTETTSFVGEVLDASGHYVPPGTRIEAFIRNVRCGETSTRRTDSFSGYTMVVAGPNAVSGCTPGAPISFRVDGQPARQHAANDIGQQHSPFDLTLA